MDASSPARSVRWPWTRGGLTGLVALVAPFVWVVETGSCGDRQGPVELTGIDVAREFGDNWWVGGPLVVAMVLAPWLAGRVTGWWRALVHLVGLGVTGLVGYGVYMVLFFSIFTERAVKAAGTVVTASAVAAVADAVFRLIAGGVELWKARRLVPPRAPPPAPPPAPSPPAEAGPG